MASYDVTGVLPTKLSAGDVLNCPYSGQAIPVELPKGIYKLECWGAQGGYRSSPTYGGKGGYAVGTLMLEEATVLFLLAGGAGNTGGTAGGFNGGGSRTTYPGGGGASDVRLGENSLYARLLVAGGGGSDGAASKTGLYGGGENGGTASEYYGTGGGGGTQTAGGAGGNSNSGTFGQGGQGLYRSSGYGGAGGGGWYGGGGAYPDSSVDDDRGGGGGSGYLWTAANAANYPSGCLLNSAHYLTDAAMIAGNAAMTLPDGTAATGNSGDGYVRVTVIEVQSCPLWLKNNGVWPRGKALYARQNGAWKAVDEEQMERVIRAQRRTGPCYIWEKLEGAEDPHTLLLISDALEDWIGGHALTNNGVQVSTEQSRFGGKSLYFGGSHYLTIDDVSLCNGSGDWTVDWWEYRTAAIGNTGTISRNGNNDNYSGLLLGYVDSIDGTLKFYASNNSSSWNVADSMASGYPLLNQWIHRSVVRSGSTFYAFENGVCKGSANSSAAFSFTRPINIGYYLGGCFSGYMDEIRISDVARWTADFTPPQEAYTFQRRVGWVTSDDPDAYPDDGVAADGYTYRRW